VKAAPQITLFFGNGLNDIQPIVFVIVSGSNTPLPKTETRPFEIRSSRTQGLGAFATRAIPAGTRLIEYVGLRMTSEEADAKYDDENGERHHTFLFAIDDDVVIDAAVDGNEARFINHSCDPNCDAVIEDGRIWIETIRDVRRGEELAYDYAYILEERHSPAAKRRYPCYCGSPNCRGTILGKKR
jgi:SET domain-containing protein